MPDLRVKLIQSSNSPVLPIAIPHSSDSLPILRTRPPLITPSRTRPQQLISLLHTTISTAHYNGPYHRYIRCPYLPIWRCVRRFLDGNLISRYRQSTRRFRTCMDDHLTRILCHYMSKPCFKWAPSLSHPEPYVYLLACHHFGVQLIQKFAEAAPVHALFRNTPATTLT